MGSQTSGLNSVLQPGEATSTPTAANEAEPRPTSGHDGDAPRVSVLGTDAVAAVPVPAPSPAISALNSEQEQNEDTGIPSRSISQLTRPTDHSPVESPRRANVERSLSRGESSATHPPATAAGSDKPSSTLAPPAPFTDRHDGSTSDAESSDRSLRVPQARRRSAISDVSSASPSPGPDAEGQHLRRSVSLSPADEVSVAIIPGPHDGNRAQVDDAVPSVNYVQGARRLGAQGTNRRPQSSDLIVAPPATTAEPFRAAESMPMVEAVEQRPPPGRLMQQSAAAEQQRDPGEHRPFSFAGVEDVGAIHEPRPLPEHDLSRFPSQPMSPVSQARSSVALSKAMSQVSVEDVQDQASVPEQRHSRSYSRPFSADPKARHHPALPAGEPEQAPIDRAHLYSSESPLPSARRAQEEIGRHLQQREQRPPTLPPQPQPYEEGYRIPGPYVQEYRSPKQISSPRNARSQAQLQASGKPLPSTLRSQTYAGQPQPEPSFYTASEQQNAPSYQGHATCLDSPAPYAEYDMKHGEWDNYTQNRPLQQQRQSMGPPATPVQHPISSQQTSVHAAPLPPSPHQPQAERKRSTFGKLFGGSSSKGSRLQKQVRPESHVGPLGYVQKEKRNSMLLRTGSASSRQSSNYASQDQLGQLPPPNVHSPLARQQPSHAPREPTPDSGDRLAEGKKKRFSGLGGKLFKSRAATTPTPPTQTTGSENQRTGQRFASPGPYSAQTPGVISPEPYSAQTPYGRYPVGPGSYFSQAQAQSPYIQTAHTRGQFSPQFPTAASPYQQHPGPFEYTHPPQSPPLAGQQASAGRYATGGFMNPSHQSRPSDLRIDTSNPNLGHYNVPATAPAQVHPRRASPFASSPYNPNPSSGITTVSGPTSPPPPSTQSPSRNPRDHVIDLHKRSRSPRLGRAASDDLDASQRQQPTSLLGTFSSKNISPVGGIPRPDNDQERPFAITVPGLDDDDNARRKHHLRDRIAAGAARSDTPVSVESGGHAAPASHLAVTTNTGGLERNVSVLEGYSAPESPRRARRESARDKTTPGVIAELPGSKAEGYESEEEIPMSATAYPGQEWMPVFVGDGRWDD
ncbi:hypothetical protein G647_00049 [Cladophialophora carrionii CBS 160.54]|uniref:Uncharacterized protein n=1 Tax=Cladophialophora carrionii CBS 160.54 TaxID=1279043 RepID=V9DL66_9EURO|nr:uncharacterized protein G647_00049 [Cladophialophora carrionii CBS 160.54]ETI27600.1 hypothetical protein G647_00049 [Cladophialophora carrionii CBS 160.54]